MADSFDIWLSCAVSSVKHIHLLLKRFGSAEGVFKADETQIASLAELTKQEIGYLTSERKEENRKRQYDYILKNDIYVYRFDEQRYPQRFHNVQDPPYCVFVQGKLPPKDVPAIAIVGSRKASQYGLNTAKLFASALANMGVYVISGLAMGIDGAGHRAALPFDGRTVGILGSGIGVPYPKENWSLYHEMRSRACIISEYGPEVPPLRQNFPHRNRLIAAMSDGILVVEAALQSGTLITVDRGLEQGKEIYAIPGRIDDRNSLGCINLIKQGARLVTGPEEIAEDLNIFSSYNSHYCGNPKQLSFEFSHECDNLLKLSNNSENIQLGLATDEKVVYSLIRLDAKHFDQLAIESGLSVSELSGVLFSLQSKGYVQQNLPNYFSATNYGVEGRY